VTPADGHPQGPSCRPARTTSSWPSRPGWRSDQGANSFTEAQAKDRALAAGLTSVSSLVKDGAASGAAPPKDGKSRKVAVDFSARRQPVTTTNKEHPS
jgi:hypothetical protein